MLAKSGVALVEGCLALSLMILVALLMFYLFYVEERWIQTAIAVRHKAWGTKLGDTELVTEFFGEARSVQIEREGDGYRVVFRPEGGYPENLLTMKVPFMPSLEIGKNLQVEAMAVWPEVRDYWQLLPKWPGSTDVAAPTAWQFNGRDVVSGRWLVPAPLAAVALFYRRGFEADGWTEDRPAVSLPVESYTGRRGDWYCQALFFSEGQGTAVSLWLSRGISLAELGRELADASAKKW